MGLCSNFNLRKIEETDLLMILEWRNKKRIRDNMFTDHIISLEEHRQWFNGLNNDNSNAYLLFEYKKIPQGVTYFNNISSANRTCTWGFYLGNDNAPKGCGSTMAKAGLIYAFNHLKLRKIYGKVFAFNVKSIKIFQKLGFQQEGFLKKHALKKGNYEDVIIFALFNHEFKTEGAYMP